MQHLTHIEIEIVAFIRLDRPRKHRIKRRNANNDTLQHNALLHTHGPVLGLLRERIKLLMSMHGESFLFTKLQFFLIKLLLILQRHPIERMILVGAIPPFLAQRFYLLAFLGGQAFNRLSTCDGVS